jgi:hypothetical protein
MKELLSPAAPERSAETGRTHARTETRIKLALLDAYNTGESQGYDPYNAGNGKRSFNAWGSKPKAR